MTKRLILCSVLLAACLASMLEVRAQSDPKQILAGMIFQVSTGTPNPSWYSPQLWQLIALQTGNTGIYPQLRQLGVVQNITLTQSAALPGGMLYAMTAQHAFGQSFWVFGIGSYTNRIEYASFLAGPGARPQTLPVPSDSGTQIPDTAAPIGTPAPAPKSPKPKPSEGQSEACKKFPNLC